MNLLLHSILSKALAIGLAAILLSSLHTGFQNSKPENTSNDNVSAFAQTPAASDIQHIQNYVLYGLESIDIEKNSTINSGSVGVDNGEAKIKSDSKFLDPSSALVANSVIIEHDTTVQHVFYNELQNDGTILGTQNTPLQIPVVESLPSFPDSIPGMVSIEVESDDSFTLFPGQYDEIELEEGATLVFSGGTYNITSIDADKNSRLFFDDSSEVVINESVDLDKEIILGPSAISDIDASDIVIYVGSNSDPDEETEIKIGKDSVIDANIFAPNGDLEMDKGTHATGAFIAKTIKIDKDSTITLDSAFDPAVKLVNEYTDIISELGQISNISDESVVTDYLNQNITALRSDTNSLVSDPDARSNLLSILDSALQSANDAGSSVLALDESGANLKITESRNFVDSYASEVTLHSGTTIPTTDANILISEANQISSNSMKRGIDATELVPNNPLIITSEIIDRAKLDVSKTRETVTELESLGFTFTATAQIMSPAQGVTTFSNAATQQEFQVIFENAATAMLGTLGIIEEALAGEVGLSKEAQALLTLISPDLALFISTLPSQESSILGTAISICIASKVWQVCAATLGSSLLYFIAIHPEVLEEFLRLAVHGGIEAKRLADEAIPTATISGIKFNDLDGHGTKESGEEGLPDWEFILVASSDAGVPPHEFGRTMTNGNGEFSFDVTLPASVKQIEVIETLKEGWESTTGQSKIVEFTPDPVTHHFVSPTLEFGNRQLLPSFLFFDNFDDGPLESTGWAVTPGFGTSVLLLQVTTGPNGEDPPSLPNWGKFGLFTPSLPSCVQNGESRISKAFSVPSEGNYNVSSHVGGSVCGGCIVSGRVLVDGILLISSNELVFDEVTVPLTAGPHTLDLGMHSTLVCSGGFFGFFDDVKVEGPVSTLTSSSLTPPVGGPYFSLQLNQTSVNVAKPDTVTIPLRINWQEGYEAEPVLVDVIGVNATGISHSVSSTYNSTSYQLFDIIFDIPVDEQSGEYPFFISVSEIDDEARVGQLITLNVQ